MRDLFLAKKARGKHALLSRDDHERPPAEKRHEDVVHAEIERELKEVGDAIPRPHAEALRRRIKVCH